MWTGAGANLFGCFAPQSYFCPFRNGHLYAAFLEVFCCPAGSTVRRLSGGDGEALIGGIQMMRAKAGVREITGIPWDGGYNLPSAVDEVWPYKWRTADERMISAVVNTVAPIALADLPGHPYITEGDIPAGTWLDVTAPADYPAGCTGPFYYVVTSKEWLDVINADGTTNCGAGTPYHPAH